MDKPVLHVMVGMPGTGKSTLIAREFSDLPVISTDNFIEAEAKRLGKTYDEVFEATMPEAQENMQNDIHCIIRDRVSAVWDQTNLNSRKRKSIIRRFGKTHRVVAHVFKTPNDPDSVEFLEWIRRLENRPGKTIPSEVLVRMLESYVDPSSDEGFDEVHYHNIYGEEI